MTSALEITLQMLNARRGLRLILGPRYAATIAPYRDILREQARLHGRPLAAIALALAQRADQLGATRCQSFARSPTRPKTFDQTE